ncbi:SulP family inorganic anion transporter [Staphylococcus sp. 17KM0847]|uniref:SulP family inorganic anion transporter n=1 Tax=Staphylococcus sp. 17KM0847 TaxID=2583989 RepID=UPI0015DC83D9|nr:SulP family inorganic anion transporter [Staphylococcus sp. 17KM0847]QLK86687.1 SulP family inorganic anion transporter [Staphylococcus sp. 17KM0847]
MANGWLHYRQSWLGAYYQNFIIGLLLALSLLPGAIAFSFIAGVSPTTSMISTSMMMIYISFFGARTLMVSAPSSGVSLVVVFITAAYSMEVLAATIIVMGIFQILLGYCNVAKAITWIPLPVVIGFMNALSYLLFVSQLKHILGHNIWTYGYAVLSFLIIWLIPRVTKRIPAPLVSIVILSMIAFLTHAKLQYVHDLAQIHVKIPVWRLPDLSGDTISFFQIAFWGAMLAIVATIQTSLTAQMMDQVTGTKSDKNKESRGQGVSNLLIGMFGGLAGSALVGQSKLNYKLGATTRLSTLITGVMMGLFVFVLEPIVGQIPMVVLATILIVVALNAFDRNTKQLIVQRRYFDFTLMALTFCLIVISKNLALGVLVGTACYYLFKGVGRS